ncbi:ABC transporter permease [Dickeya solani]
MMSMMPKLTLNPPRPWSFAPLSAACSALLMPLLLVCGWWLASHYDWMSEQILPSPATVADSARDFIPQELAPQLLVSLARLAIGLAGGIALGLTLGVLFGLSRTLDRLGMPLFNVLAQIPTLAWIPLLMLALGISEALKLVVLIKAVTVPVTLCTCAGIRQTPQTLYEMARTLRLPWPTRLRRLVIPAMLPYVMTGTRLAFSQGWVSLIAVELLASSEGLGYLMVQSRQLFMLDLVLVCILVIGAFGLAGEQALQRLERRWIFWPAPVLSHESPTPHAAWHSLAGWLLPALLCLLWQLATDRQWVHAAFLPAPREVVTALLAGLGSGELTSALSASLSRTLAGFTLGASLGCLLGSLLGRSRVADRLLTPLLSALRSVALFAWLPLLTAWFGLEESAKVVFIALAAFFPALLASYQGVRHLPPSLLETARVLRLSARQRLRWLVLPAMLPALFSGLRLSLMHAWVGAIGAEYFISSGDGVGSMMIRAQQLFQSERVIAGVLLIALVSTLFYRLITLAERRLTAWRVH